MPQYRPEKVEPYLPSDTPTFCVAEWLDGRLSFRAKVRGGLSVSFRKSGSDGDDGKYDVDSLLRRATANDYRLGVECGRDAMSGKLNCESSVRSLHFERGVGPVQVAVVGGSTYPRSLSQIRIDSSPAFSGMESQDFKSSAQIVARISNAKTVRTRFINWPYRATIDEEIDGDQASKGLDLLNAGWTYSRQLKLH